MKRVVILGSTGSIGTQTLDVIAEHPSHFEVVGLAARVDGELLQEQAARFGVRRIALYEPHASIPPGMNAIVDLATMAGADIVVVSVAGVIGLIPTIEAIKAGKDIALASKEVLVAAGELVMPLVRKHGVKLTPIDSEHSAIFQCIEGAARPISTPQPPSSKTLRLRSGQAHLEEGGTGIEELILTASGGPFRGRSRADLAGVSVEDALNHPTWRMGGKITIDSATLMNKGLETIEARWLFDVPIERLRVVVHPQSIIHSMVKFWDGSVLAQMGWPNMRLPILYALSHPDRLPNTLKPWNPIDTPQLTFEPVDDATFPSIRIARDSMNRGGTMPCVMNAANEEAANAFLRGEIPFLAIPDLVEGTMARHDPLDPTLDNLLASDVLAREIARNLIQAL